VKRQPAIQLFVFYYGNKMQLNIQHFKP